MTFKGLLLGTAAGLFAAAGAQAADLPVKAKPVEYVKICSLYGAGFYYIPGTNTCIKLGGAVRVEYIANAGGTIVQDANGVIAQGVRAQNTNTWRSRSTWNLDTRTQTEYGTLRTFQSWRMDVTTAAAGTSFAAAPFLINGYVQFAGFTFGKATTIWDPPGSVALAGMNNSTFLGPDTTTGFTQLTYTHQFGNGVSGAVSIVDSSLRPTRVYNSGTAITSNSFTNSATGQRMPDVMAAIKVDQAWGSFSVAGLLHEVSATYYTPTNELSGWPNSKLGWGINAGIQLKALPTGQGDSFWLSGGYTEGATNYLSGAAPYTNYGLFGSSSTAYKSVGFSYILDGVYSGAGGPIQLTKMYGGLASFEHYWIPGKVRSSVFGQAYRVDYNATANALMCGKFTFAAGSTCNFDFTYYGVGTRTAWTPVSGFTISGEVMYSRLDFAHSGNVILTGGASAPSPKPPVATAYELKDQGIWSGGLRIERSF